MSADHDMEQGAALPPTRRSSIRLSALVALCVFAGIIGFYLYTQHRIHLNRFIPYLLLFLCPLLHVFHHRMHGGNRSDHAGHHGGQ